ncbi:N-acetyl-gamma-glutamyl-phosphate reductase [Candidatus Peregrinibacteria bacterium]|nr:N-acetyl-gamma-glutamyl-phosphate reductase [Candidatus Peregrinibacteria bacterium]
MSQKIKVSVIGATGYTGLELIRLIQGHPHIELTFVTSESATDKKLSEVWTHLQGICDIALSHESLQNIAKKSDCIFLTLPHTESQKIVPKLLGLTKIIDLSADFRLNKDHELNDGISKFLYGVPEFYKNEIARSSNIANPGCFAIASELALWPIKDSIDFAYVLGITGSSGSGKSFQESTHHPVRNHNVKSYKIGMHQHEAEILQTLDLSFDQFVLVPTSGPFVRGIHVTVFVHLKKSFKSSQKENIVSFFINAYEKQPFVRIKPEVQIADVVGSNFCDISITLAHGTIIIQAVIDNLIKGASGNAIQNFNLMFGLDETCGLKIFSPVFP